MKKILLPRAWLGCEIGWHNGRVLICIPDDRQEIFPEQYPAKPTRNEARKANVAKHEAEREAQRQVDDEYFNYLLYLALKVALQHTHFVPSIPKLGDAIRALGGRCTNSKCRKIRYFLTNHSYTDTDGFVTHKGIEKYLLECIFNGEAPIKIVY